MDEEKEEKEKKRIGKGIYKKKKIMYIDIYKKALSQKPNTHTHTHTHHVE